MSLGDFFFPAHIITPKEFEEVMHTLKPKLTPDEEERLNDIFRRAHIKHRGPEDSRMEGIQVNDLQEALEYLSSHPEKHPFAPEKLAMIREAFLSSRKL